MITQLAWRAYSLANLALRPQVFFSKLTELDWYHNMLIAWVDWTKPQPGSHLLELGCSGGALCRAMVARECSVVGLDRSARAVKHARRASECANLDFVIGNALCPPFPESCFDCTLAASLLNVVSARETLISEMARITAVNGVVSLLFPTPYMQRDTAYSFIRNNGLSGFSADAILLWATNASKLLPSEATSLLAGAQLVDIRGASLLDGMVHAIAGRKVRDRSGKGQKNEQGTALAP